MNLQLAGLKALVAGATGDIGSAVAAGLAAEGAKVIIAGRDNARLTSVEASLGPACEGIVIMDFADEASIQRGIEEAYALAPEIDIVVCTVVSNTFGSVWELSRKDWEDLFRIKYMGTVDLSRGVARRFPMSSRATACISIRASSNACRRCLRRTPCSTSCPCPTRCS